MMKWSIGIYTGPSPLALGPGESGDRPVLTGGDATDVRGFAVADPFLLVTRERWYLFFEVVNLDTRRGEIAFATSRDGVAWAYGAVVLREPFHLSYPQVFVWEDETYMIPESRRAEEVRLYRAEEFPHRWRCVATLLRGRFADATLLRHDDRWWLFAQRGLDELRLFSSLDLATGWHEHPASPLWVGDRHRTRPAGPILRYGERMLRFAQDGLPTYGNSVRAFEVDRLDTSRFDEHELPESPILQASMAGWNALGMHHVHAVELRDGGWLAAVDGAGMGIAPPP